MSQFALGGVVILVEQLMARPAALVALLQQRVVAQGGEGCRDFARDAGRKVDVIGLQDAADVGLVRCAGAQALDCRLLVSEGHEEGIGELCRIKGLLGEFGNGLLFCTAVDDDPLD